MKLLATVLLSVGLSLSALLGGQAYQNSSEKAAITQLRQASWRVSITTDGETEMGSCSGTFIAKHYFLTAAHCLPDPRLTLVVGGEKALVVKQDSMADLLLLMVPIESPYIPVALPKSLSEGTDVVVVGYPFGIAQYVTTGSVQGPVTIPPQALMMEYFPDMFAVSAGISPGNSGGGIFVKINGTYHLVGVVSRGGGIIALGISPKELNNFFHPKESK